MVGRNIRLHRTRSGMTQAKLGAAIGVTFQQVQKYERGIDLVAASRLHEICKALDTPIDYMFQQQGENRPGASLASRPPATGLADT